MHSFCINDILLLMSDVSIAAAGFSIERNT